MFLVEIEIERKTRKRRETERQRIEDLVGQALVGIDAGVHGFNVVLGGWGVASCIVRYGTCTCTLDKLGYVGNT